MARNRPAPGEEGKQNLRSLYVENFVHEQASLCYDRMAPARVGEVCFHLPLGLVPFA